MQFFIIEPTHSQWPYVYTCIVCLTDPPPPSTTTNLLLGFYFILFLCFVFYFAPELPCMRDGDSNNYYAIV